ncbi:MAG: hypothetical protein QGH41_08495, partial [Roseibacillus sp.]|nr:hypothetical protein [Roseibacillus sp.]
MNIDQETLRSVVEKVMTDLARTVPLVAPVPAKPEARAPAPIPSPAPVEKECACRSTAGDGQGIFGCVNIAVNAAHDAFLQLKSLGLEGRSRVIEIV